MNRDSEAGEPMETPEGEGPRVTIIIVSYNTVDLTLACIASVFDQTRELPFELIVVDNDSSDGSAEAIRERYPEIRLHALTENLGFGAANNLAAAEARGEYLLLLNPDTVVLDRAVERLVGYAETRGLEGIVGGRTVLPDGTLDPTCCWARPTLWSMLTEALCLTVLFPRSRILNTQAMAGWQRDSEREVDIVTGCFLLIPMKLWRALRGFDPAFFMYGEDFDLNLRALELGCASSFTPDATIVHVGGASERVREDKLVRLLRGQCRLLKNHWPPTKLFLGLRFKLLGVWLRARLGQIGAALCGNQAAGNELPWLGAWRRRSEWLIP